MRRANPERGEVELALGDACFLLRPSFAALVAAEAEVGSLFALLERAGAGELRLSEIGGLLWHCLAEPEMPRAQFETMLAAAGLRALLPAYRALLAAVFGGG